MTAALCLLLAAALTVVAVLLVRESARPPRSRLRAMKELDPGYLEVQAAMRYRPAAVTHFWPPATGPDYVTPCCGIDPLDLPGRDKFTYKADEVNCPSALTGGGS